jgi:hypothetical protein
VTTLRYIPEKSKLQLDRLFIISAVLCTRVAVLALSDPSAATGLEGYTYTAECVDC